ncbi:hypothetical protein [uncultured Jannaschia sp.]|nr:hypothetical protein [uncultured Jannaschia sp.]
MTISLKAGSSALALSLLASTALAQDLQIENAEWWQEAARSSTA